jgi:hypothetical protein
MEIIMPRDSSNNISAAFRGAAEVVAQGLQKGQIAMKPGDNEKPQGGGKSILRPPNELKPLIITEMQRRGGRVEVAIGRKPGKDRDLFAIVAEALGVSEEDRKKTIGEINPEIFKSKRKDPEKDAKRNAWDYNMQVAVQQLKDPRFGGPFIFSPKHGVWELTSAGDDEATGLIRERK